MIAKIGHGTSIAGALKYNMDKVARENGTILCLHRMAENPTGKYSLGELRSAFDPYLSANRRTENPAVHISLNPDPKDGVSDGLYVRLAEAYMQEMGYGSQPYAVFKHTDTERTHIHIVSTCVARDGTKISDSYEKRRSMKACRKLEALYGLSPTLERSTAETLPGLEPVHYGRGNVKAQIAAVVRHLPRHYRFQGIGTYNALLSLFNVRAEIVNSESYGRPRQGLTYFALEDGIRTGIPFKASLFGREAGIARLQEHFARSKETMADPSIRKGLKELILPLMHANPQRVAFCRATANEGISTVVLDNDQGRTYGITFVDHNTRTVWNGSQLGRELSANAFHALWHERTSEEAPVRQELSEDTQRINADGIRYDGPLDALAAAGLIFSGLLPGTQPEDYEEIAFGRRMKRKKKKGK
ncbi:relaxase/mobilization nuclease domain-containing protein [Flavobacterium sp. WW92]|uniref:relaxase/mobilization nuclease domain-containing protein n=1 Tax=unclassified Flavobacterium TaxID=196869 RepID=UPI002224B4F0|nr:MULTISPECIES: relaxase/mobilization nuclease domain-containing protein [unclassified Flavobacterium]WDO12316.1 relaxase/mobilization nuclease domain-containing protein [Flavobacterium sp. WW92]